VQKNPRPLLSLDSGLPEDQSAQNLEAMANHSSYFKFDASSASGRPTSVWIMLTRHFQWRNPTEREIGSALGITLHCLTSHRGVRRLTSLLTARG